MALPPVETVQVLNVELAPERQKLLRARLEEVFGLLARRARVKKRLAFITNADGDPLDKVLRINHDADALLTGFHYEAEHSEAYKREAVAGEELSVEPQLRYPVLATYLRHADQGHFRHLRLVLVGDVHERLAAFLRSGLPVQLTVPPLEAGAPPRTIDLTAMSRVTAEPDAELTAEGPIPIGRIQALTVADVPFAGVIHMPEEDNRFVFKDNTLVDVARRLYVGSSAREQAVRERIAEDKLHFVRGKRVLLVLDPDLEHVVAERLTFDRMDNLWRFHSVDEALPALERAPTQAITDYFEREGYGLLFDALDQDERDRLLVALLGPELPAHLERVVATVRPLAGQMDPDDLQQVLYNLPPDLLDALLADVQAKAYERFLALVPARIREQVIVDFLRRAERVQAAWRALEQAQRSEVVQAFQPWLLADLYLLDSERFRKLFPGLQFEFQRTYDSAMLGKMGAEEQNATLVLIAKRLGGASLPPQAAGRLTPDEVERHLADFVHRRPEDFYNGVSAVVRKQIWLTVGRQDKAQIGKGLHALDKIEILQGLGPMVGGLLFQRADLVPRLVAQQERDSAATVFLVLKKLDKAESKTALLRKLLGEEAHRERRLAGVPAFLTDPQQRRILEKLTDRVEDLEPRFDSLICTRADRERLAGQPALEGAVVTLVDDLVDPGLFRLFERGPVSREDYDSFSRTVEQELARLRRRMMQQEGDDPVGVYLLETMQIFNEMANRTLTGSFSSEELLRVDARQEIRLRLMASFRDNLEQIDKFLRRAAGRRSELQREAGKLESAAEAQEQAFQQAYAKAADLLAECQRLLEVRAQAEQQRKTVALTQRELSLQFFEIIEPLLLDKMRSLGNPLKALLRMMGLSRQEQAAVGRERVIFRFTDEQIANILRYRIVFCSRDPVLMRFVATCLRIDGLEDSLFHLATAETLPQRSDIDILFYGPGYTVADFADVKEHRMVPFADEAFYERLKANERLKARTKSTLNKTVAALQEKKRLLGQANQAVKAEQAKRREIEARRSEVAAEQARLEQSIHEQEERRQSLQSEQAVLETRFGEIDQRFNAVKARVATLAGEGKGAKALQVGREKLADTLRNELTDLNRELARLMFIKGVKDAGEHISRNTRDGMLARMEARETLPPGYAPRALVVADDGSQVGRNLRQAFVTAALRHFKLSDRAVRNVSIGRLTALSAQATAQDYDFMALFADAAKDDYAELKRALKTLRKHLPEAYLLLVTPCGDLAEHGRRSPHYRNLVALRDQAALVNASLSDYTAPAAMQRLLREKAPPAATAAAGPA